jgi:16S rRNA (cytosine967-C5)-methyltransferase
MKDTAKNTARALALDLLVKAQRSAQFSNIALDKALDTSALSDADKRLVSVLFYGVIERRITLDYRIAELSSRPISEIDDKTLNILRLGIYQLTFTDKIPTHAAINETVELCTARTKGFVNAILRSHTRSETAFPNKDTEFLKYLSVKYSVCEELCEKFVAAYGEARANSILSAFCRIPDTTLRTNTLKISTDELCEHIEGAKKAELAPNALSVRGAVRELYGFSDGLFFVQDEASQICVEALGAKEGETVIDICACPGSKSFGAAINMKNAGKILAFELHESKLSLILKSAERLGINIIEVAKQDGRIPLSQYFGTADRVLCDVPCSGFGVLAKKPELRYKSPSECKALPDIQLSILENACRYVKDGGTLIYSTCTVFPEENEQNVRRFLGTHKEFSLTPFSVGALEVKDGFITLLPDEYPTDGFFIAKLTKGNVL